MENKILYAVGERWDEDDNNSSIGFYTYGSEIFHGTLNEAIDFRDYCNSQKPNGNYRIFQLTEIPNSKYMSKTKIPAKKADRNSEVKVYTEEQKLDAIEKLKKIGVLDSKGNPSPEYYTDDEIKKYKKKKRSEKASHILKTL